VYTVGDVRQIEIHTAEPLVPVSNSFEAEFAISNLKNGESPGTD
jgi:hypothetical protein